MPQSQTARRWKQARGSNNSLTLALAVIGAAGVGWWWWRQKRQQKEGGKNKGPRHSPKQDRGSQSVTSTKYDANEGRHYTQRTTFESKKGKVVMKQETVGPGRAKRRPN